MTTYTMNEDVMSELLNDVQAKQIVVGARSGGSDKLSLRSYHLPEYQYQMIDALADLHDMSKAAVLRQIIDEWYILKLSER